METITSMISKRSRPTTSVPATASETMACTMFLEEAITTRQRQRLRPRRQGSRRILASALFISICPSFSQAQTTTTATTASAATTTSASTTIPATTTAVTTTTGGTTMAATSQTATIGSTLAQSTPAAQATATQAAQDTPSSPSQQQLQHKCPPDYNGWAPSSDCASYFWCSSGQLASIPYDCVEGTLFDAEQLTCLPSAEVDCAPVVGTTTTTVAATTTAAQTTSSTVSPTPLPTSRPTSLGPAIYFVDFPSQSCKTDLPPEWITPDQLFTTKEECCNVMMDWIPLETCLGGANYTETNYFFAPTESPTNNPTWSPSFRPSDAPSYSPSSSEPTVSPTTATPTGSPTWVPTAAPNNSPTRSPSLNPTISPSQFVSLSPTISPTTDPPTPSPTVDPQILLSAKLEAASKVENTYLVDLIGWANQGMESYSLDTLTGASDSFYAAVATYAPTPSPADAFSDLSLSTLLLPVADDATVSQQRPQINFGSHQALAVDGGNPAAALGDSVGETFDTLLKFDVSLVDFARPIERVTLRLYVVEGCESGGTVSSTRDAEWDSESVTWENAPAADGVWVGQLPPVVAGQWYDVDVTLALSASTSTSSSLDHEQYLSLRLESDANSRCLYSSMEGGESVSPQLVVQYDMEQTVIARDDALETTAGQEQGPPLTPPVIGDFLLLKATDDATVVGSNPTRNFGTEPNLLVAFDTGTRGIFDTLIRFDLRELVSTPPRTAVLSLYAETDCVSAGTFVTTAGDDDWTEDRVTWASAPVYEPQNGSHDGGTSLGVFGSVEAETWNAFNVLNAVKDAVKFKKSALTFRLSSGNLEPCQFSSRDGGRAPKLMVAF